MTENLTPEDQGGRPRRLLFGIYPMGPSIAVALCVLTFGALALQALLNQ